MDMDDLDNLGDQNVALERVMYQNFLKNSMVYKLNHLPNRISSTDVVLPGGSVLHYMDRCTDFDGDSVVPNIANIPFIKNDPSKTWMYHVFTTTEDEQFAPAERGRQVLPPIISGTQQFHRGRREFRRLHSLEDVMATPVTHLPVINYDGIFNTIFVGPRKDYHKFEAAFRSILATAAQIEGKYQFIHIPMNYTLYNYIDFQKPLRLKEMPQSVIKTHGQDSGFYALVHFIKYFIDGQDSLIAQLPQSVIDNTTFTFTVDDLAIFYPLNWMMRIKPDENFYRRILRHINTMKMLASSNMKIEDLDKLDDDQFEQVVQVNEPNSKYFSQGKTDVETPTPVVVPESADNKTIETDISRTDPESGIVVPERKIINNFSKQAVSVPMSSDERSSAKPEVISDENDTLDEVVITPTVQKNRTTSTLVDTALSKTRTGVDVKDTNIYSEGYTESEQSTMDYFDDAAEQAVNSAQNVSGRRRQRLVEVSQAYKSVEINGTPTEVLLSQDAHPPVDDHTVKALDTLIEDKSMLKSTIFDFDEDYITKLADRDLAAVLSSFATAGMFLVDVETEDEVNKINQIRHYKVTYEDVNGKRHRVQFKLPIVRKDGTFIINGIVNRMHKQQVNLPIAKISPTRVSLASYYNKALVDRTTSVAHSYKNFISNVVGILNKYDPNFTISYGNFKPVQKLPYEYTAIGSKFSNMMFRKYHFIFDPKHRTELLAKTDITEETLIPLEQRFGILIGKNPSGELLFMNMDNLIRTEQTPEFTTMYNIFREVYQGEVTLPSMVTEWTELKIQDKNIPVAFVLCFRYGLRTMLKYLKVKWEFFPKGQRASFRPTDVLLRFADGTLVFRRYPLLTSLIIGGFNKYDLRRYNIAEMDSPDVYYSILEDKGMSTNYLKGINSFFDLFIDPITRDVLASMKEPTNVRDLLIRATELVTTEECIQPSSMRNHRIRSYERFNGIIYNVISRQLAQFKSQRGDRAFSINPQAVFMQIVSDQSVGIVEETNPAHEMKERSHITYTGQGGRTSKSFVLEDRKFPDDGTGILSESTPDSGKVAISAFMTMNPHIKNMRGLFEVDAVDFDNVEPGRLLSATALLMPCSTNDDELQCSKLPSR